MAGNRTCDVRLKDTYTQALYQWHAVGGVAQWQESISNKINLFRHTQTLFTEQCNQTRHLYYV